jgi:predicted dehydrogenase
MRVGLIGCGRMGRKRAAALGSDTLVGCYDVDSEASASLAAETGAPAVPSVDALLESGPDVVVVATTHQALAELAGRAVEAGAHVLVEKPGATTAESARALERAAADRGRVVKVGFNHRFHPGIARCVEEARSGAYGDVMFVRGRYGHGGRVGYEQEWRARRELSGGGELMDQGMHLLDLCHWLVGPLPLHSALLRTHFWDVEVEDNAALVLGESGDRRAPWAMLHASWTEWKNEFALEVYCRTAKLAVGGLWGSYGPQRLVVYRMRPELGPPDVEEHEYGDEDSTWEAEWRNFREAALAGDPELLLGDLNSAAYALEQVEAAYRLTGYA